MDLKDYTNKEEIKKLFDLYEETLYEHSEKNKELVRQIIETEEALCETFTSEQKELFEKLSTLRLKNESETDKNIFVFTYCLATKLILQSIG